MAQKEILVVEDEVIIAEAIAESLKKQGYKVTAIVSTGEEAIQEAAATQPDLVLMDIVLEGDMDGIAAADKIRTDFNIPTVFLTAYADEETLQRAKLTDPFGYILKPFQQRDLHATIEIALHRHELETKMRQALETAEQKANRQSKYVSIAAHELRNPLSAIVGSAKLLELNSSKLDEETQIKCLNLMKSASQTMSQLIEDMLVIGRAESEQLKFNPAPLNLEEFCRRLVEQMQLEIEKKHQLSFDCIGEKTIATLDQRLLHHILSNLLSNAIKYSPQGGEVRLELEFQEAEAEALSPIRSDPVVIFRIQDSGIGIPKEDQDKLFEAFHRCSNVGEIKGTGLGLAIVKKAVELHGGAIAFESKVGVGTTFIIILPSIPLTASKSGS
jgi:signal transduction histidine kinase